MVVCLAGNLSGQSTNFDKEELIGISTLAWQPYKYLIKDGIFMTKDIAVLKAKLMIFDHYFGAGPYSNKYYTDLKKADERIRKVKTILSIAIPTTIVLFTGAGFAMGFRLSMRIN
jgi:hypothetical protein